jgi:hypothetical protein
MEEHGEPRAERIFEIVWHQHNSDDWVAEVKDTQTDQRRQVSSLEELEQFIQSQIRIAALLQTAESPESEGAGLECPVSLPEPRPIVL